MYRHLIEPFGKFEKHTLISPDGGNTLVFVPEHGACVLDLTFEGTSVLDGYLTPAELDFNRWSKNVVLFPFPNRLQDGRFAWLDKIYQWPINDAHTGNALHGFGADKPMLIKQLELNAESAAVSCEYTYDGYEVAFPFPFRFIVQFILDQRNQLKVEMMVENNGQTAMPFGFGWHPYFRLADEIDKVEMQLPAVQLIGVDRRMIPNGRRYDYDEFEEMRPIGVTVLDNCFALPDNRVETSVYLQGDRGKLRYWQETGPGKFNFLQIFTPPHRQSIALEPMSCNVDSFNNGEGLIILQPGQQAEASFGVKFTPAD